MHEDAAQLAESESVSRPPFGVLVIWRVGILVTLAAYYFVVACIARGILGGFGWHFGNLIQVLLGAAVMTAFVIWLAPLVELPEIWYQHRAPAKRQLRGLCPQCGYERGHTHPSDATASGRCPECGAPDALRPAWEFGSRTLRHFLFIALVAYAIGCLGAMWWVMQDEAAFQREATMSRGAFARSRAWPAQFAQLSIDVDGTLSAHGLATEGEIDPTWKKK